MQEKLNNINKYLIYTKKYDLFGIILWKKKTPLFIARILEQLSSLALMFMELH